MAKRVQAKHIADRDFLAVVDKTEREQHRWTFFWDVAKELNMPEKVVLAKARALIERKLMTGCPCGCRGDYELTDAGEEMLRAT